MTPNFTEANAVTSLRLSEATIEQERKDEFTTKGFEEFPLETPGTLKRAVDVYRGPDGDGYVIRFIYEVKGERWCRCEARGPQAFRSHNWIKVPIL